jgi:ArsR family transcriptional regulator
MEQRETMEQAKLVEIFKALADETRLKILEALKQSNCCSCAEIPPDEPGMCVCDVVGIAGLSQPTVSHHLAILERAGLIQGKKIGRWVYYRRNEPFLKKLSEEFDKAV